MLATIASIEDAIAASGLRRGRPGSTPSSRSPGTASINYATVVKLRAERRIAEYVDQGQAAGQIAEQGRPGKVRSPDVSELADLGLTAQRVHEARTIRGRYGDPELVALGNTATAKGRLLSRDKIVRAAGWALRETQQGRYADTPPPSPMLDVLLVDPPWRYAVHATDARAIEGQYPFDDGLRRTRRARAARRR